MSRMPCPGLKHPSRGRNRADGRFRPTLRCWPRRVAPGLSAALLCLLAIAGLKAAGPRAGPQQSQRQDVIRFGIDLKLEPLKLAVADFRPAGADVAPSLRVFNEVLWNDLDYAGAGIFDLVSKSFYPLVLPGRPPDLTVPGAMGAWAGPPVNAQVLAFGNAYLSAGQLVIEGYLYDVSGAARPEVLARRYTNPATEPGARAIAHRFANAILERLGGGLPGIAESKIYFVRKAGAVKEIWAMDYDGANQRPVTQYGSLSLTPAVSPDGTQLAFTSYWAGNPQIFVLSLASLRRLPFQNPSSGLNTTPAWSPDGRRLAFCSSLTHDPEIYATDDSGRNLRRLTSSRGVDITPVWNPKTGAQIAFVSDRGGLPQVYVMDADGSNVRKLSGGEGDAVTPAWAPNGQILAFSWTRGFAPGNYNIFLMDVASGQLVQLTHGAGRNEHPWFSPDGRHIVFESDRKGGKQIFSMLADGSKVRALTTAGENTSPVWSAR